MLSCLGRKVTVFPHSGIAYGSVSYLGDKASTISKWVFSDEPICQSAFVFSPYPSASK